MMQKSRFIFPEEMLNLSKSLSFLTVGHCHPVRAKCRPVTGRAELGRMDAAAQVEGEVQPFLSQEGHHGLRCRAPERVCVCPQYCKETGLAVGLWRWGGDALVVMSVGEQTCHSVWST